MDKVYEKCLMLLGSFWAILLPIQQSILLVFLLVFADLIVGVWAAVKEGYKISSRSLRRTVVKLLVYEVVVIVTFMVETLLVDYPVAKIATGLIGIVEGKSFFENLYRITKVDFLKIIIDKLQLINNEIKPASSKDEIKTYKGKRRDDKEEQKN
jgi:phage-related holin